MSIRSCSDGLVSSQALDVTLHDGAGEQSNAVSSRGVLPNLESALCVTPRALRCCWGGHQPGPCLALR